MLNRPATGIDKLPAKVDTPAAGRVAAGLRGSNRAGYLASARLAVAVTQRWNAGRYGIATDGDIRWQRALKNRRRCRVNGDALQVFDGHTAAVGKAPGVGQHAATFIKTALLGRADAPG